MKLRLPRQWPSLRGLERKKGGEINTLERIQGLGNALKIQAHAGLPPTPSIFDIAAYNYFYYFLTPSSASERADRK